VSLKYGSAALSQHTARRRAWAHRRLRGTLALFHRRAALSWFFLCARRHKRRFWGKEFCALHTSWPIDIRGISRLPHSLHKCTCGHFIHPIRQLLDALYLRVNEFPITITIYSLQPCVWDLQNMEIDKSCLMSHSKSLSPKNQNLEYILRFSIKSYLQLPYFLSFIKTFLQNKLWLKINCHTNI
jgi:hypothetical protein